ncbi:MAG TPA: hypothetical protein VHX86_06020 [Tepidisphaeraceae bacterium]|jgi:hypothetical protein|nr:hypothetical protein [Tepidisphaeraceae bacterium]
MKSGRIAGGRIAIAILSMMLAAGLGLRVRGDIAATEPAATQPSQDVSALISDLASPDFSVRELAEKKLMDLGPDIEPTLRTALQGKLSDEARARLDDVLGQLDETKALHASVTLHYKDAPMTTVLNEFAWQAGADMGVREPAVTGYAQDRTASIDLDNADFWQSLRAISDATGLHPWVGQAGVTLSPSEQRTIMQINFANRYALETGGLYIAPQFTQETRTTNYNENADSSTLILSIDVIPEPKLHVVGAANMDWLKECVDDKGHSLMPSDMNRRSFFARNRPRLWAWPLQVTLQSGTGIGTKIARLRGELDFSVQTRAQTLEIDDITRAANVTKSDGDMSVTVLNCTRTNMNYQLSLEFHGAEMGSASVQDFLNSAELVDADGQSAQRQAFIPTRNVPNGGGLVINMIFFPMMNTPSKLRWERTLEQKRLSVPFELDNLPLRLGVQ